MIEEYKFGSITIDDKTYKNDIEVRWTGEVLKWWRKEGHIFAIDDIKRALQQNPDLIILGTGYYGTAKVTEDCKKLIEEKGIELIIKKTKEATKVFNRKLKQGSCSDNRKNPKVIGLFHLTC